MNIIKGREGSTLLIVLMILVFVSALITVTQTKISDKMDRLLKQRILDSRDAVVTAALRNARVGTYFYYTILHNDPENHDLIHCLLPNVSDSQGDDCVSLDGSGNPVRYNFLLRTAMPPSGPIVIGTPTAPVLYDLLGQVCPTVGPNCPFEVFGTFTASCSTTPSPCSGPGGGGGVSGGPPLPGTSPCHQAMYINVEITVRVHASLNSQFLPVSPITGNEIVYVADFWNSFNPILPPTTVGGAPVTGGAGPVGNIMQLECLSTLPGPSPIPAPPPPPSGPPSTMMTCPPGQTRGPGGSCGKVGF